MNSAATTPTKDVRYWINVIHNAASVGPDHPRHAEARQVIEIAKDNLSDLAGQATEKDWKDIQPGALGTAAVNFGHGASLGLAGDPAYLALSKQAHPVLAGASDIAGTAATATLLGGSPVFAGASPVITGGVVGGATAAARGAIEPLPNFSRLETAALYGIGGALGGAIAGKLTSKLLPWAAAVAKNIRSMVPGLSASEAGGLSESAIRAELGRLKVAPDVIERTVASWKAAGPRVGAPPEPPAPPVLRPGETVEQIAPNGFAVKGPRVTPPAPTTPTVTEILSGRGQTLPYYPRGGLAEQSIAPPPSQAPVQLSPNQNAAFIEFLKGASSPQEQAARVGTLKALGVLPGPSDADALLSLLQVGSQTPR